MQARLENGAEPLLDPQCYVRDADYARLTQHRYWQTYRACSTSNLLTGSGARDVIASLSELDRALGITRHILPGLLAQPVSNDWFRVQEQFVEAGIQEFGREPLISTIALCNEAVRDEAQVEAVIERAADWPVAGLYLVGEAPGGYLVEDPNWLANMLILASGLKLLGKNVIVGYSSHQMLCLAACNVDVIASGTWLNVRAFLDREVLCARGRRCVAEDDMVLLPQVLSEYKLPFLDIARRVGVLEQMRADPALVSVYADPLFAVAQPSAVRWGEQNAFRHYLTCLRGQCRRVTGRGFVEAMEAQTNLLDVATSGLRTLRAAGVFGNDRDFWQVLDANRSALAVFEQARGARLRREWQPPRP